MRSTKYLVAIALVAVLGGSRAAPATSTDNNPPPTGAVATATSNQSPGVTTQDEPLAVVPVTQKQRQRLPLRTGGKPLPVPSTANDDNQINENLDLSSGETPNLVFVPIISQNFYFPDRSYLPMTRNVFGGDLTSLGGFQDPIRRNVDNAALIDSFLFRQNQDSMLGGGGQLSFTDRINAFRDWLLSLVPFRIEFVRPGTPRPLVGATQQGNISPPVNLIPNTNIPNTSNNIPTTPNTFPSTMHHQKIVPNYPVKSGVPAFSHPEYLQPEVGLTNRNYQTSFNNFRNVHPMQTYPYRPNNVYPYTPTNTFPVPYGRSVDGTPQND